jgi:hypothetical protein
LEQARKPSRSQPKGFAVYLLREVENFLRSSNVPPARFGREVMGDPRFVFDLRNGREPRPRTVERIRRFLETAR